MKKKTKFITCILTQDEWNLIKGEMKHREEVLEDIFATYNKCGNKVPLYAQNEYKIVYHFNHVAIDNIEDLANKEERRRKSDRKKQRKI